MTLPRSSTNPPACDLRELMVAHSLTQRDVASLACVSTKTVEGWLADKAAASHRTMHVRHLRSIRLALPGYIKAAKRGEKGKT